MAKALAGMTRRSGSPLCGSSGSVAASGAVIEARPAYHDDNEHECGDGVWERDARGGRDVGWARRGDGLFCSGSVGCDLECGVRGAYVSCELRGGPGGYPLFRVR